MTLRKLLKRGRVRRRLVLAAALAFAAATFHVGGIVHPWVKTVVRCATPSQGPDCNRVYWSR